MADISSVPSVPKAIQTDVDGNYIFEWKASMSCGSCSGAVKNKLSKFNDSVIKVDADHVTKLVTITYKPDGTSVFALYTTLEAAIPQKLLERYPPIEVADEDATTVESQTNSA